MLDFVCDKKTTNRRLLRSLLRQLNQEIGIGEGFLLETTNSYHYYGGTVLSSELWIKFIGFSLLLQPPASCFPLAISLGIGSVIDARFLGHSLIARQGSLRISADAAGDLPAFIGMIENE